MSSGERAERKNRRRDNRLAVRFGGSMTGVGIAGSVLNIFWSGSASTTYVSVVLLVVGLALLAVGHRNRVTRSAERER